MCTNYRPTARELVREYFGNDLHFSDAEDFRSEVYPGHLAPIIRKACDEGNPVPGLECAGAVFGLIPIWSKDGKNYRHTYNARTETVFEKPSYRTPWKKRQFCVVPMDAFFEPNYETGKPVRWRIERSDQRPLLIGAIWDVWKNTQDQWVRSFSMLTINADDHPVMKQFHPPTDEKRALVMLERDQVSDWLNATTDEAVSFFSAYPAEQLTAYAEPIPPRAKSTAPSQRTSKKTNTT